VNIEGLKRNSSISSIKLSLDGAESAEVELALLNAYQENNTHLTLLAILGGDLLTNIGQNLVEQTAATLRMCTNYNNCLLCGLLQYDE